MKIGKMIIVLLFRGGLVLFFVLALSGYAVSEGQLGPWTHTSSLNTAREYLGAAAYNSNIYVMGGAGANGLLNSVEYAQINSNGLLSAFSYTSSLNTARNGVGVTVYNGYIYAVGGNSGWCTNIVEYAKINADGSLGPWSYTSSLKKIRTNIDFVATYNGYIYALGGADCSGVQSSVEYAKINADGSLGPWSFTSSMNVPRNGLGVAAYNGYIYAAGATYSFRTVEYAKINADGTIGSWSFTSSMNTILFNSGVVQFNDYLYAVGGVDIITDVENPANAVEYAQINPDGTLGTWVATSNLNIGRLHHDVTNYNGYIYAIGGYNNGFLSSVEVAAVHMRVTIDIKPGSFPNSINLSSAGVVPVAILSSPTFDATQVDPATVSLAGAKVKLIGKGDKYSANFQDVNDDGLLDLVCHVVTAQFMIEAGDSIAVLEANTFGGQGIRGEDSIQIVP